MSVKLYCALFSPAVRAVIHTMKALNVPYELIDVDIPKGEQRSPEYLKLNPQHTVPTIEDKDGFVIWESHAINAYLVDKYGKDDELYPKELKARAIVNQRLYFDNGVLFPLVRNTLLQIVHSRNISKLTEDMKKPIEDGYDFVEKFLCGRQYIAGDHLTIADFSFLTTLTNMKVFLPANDVKYPLITDYVKRKGTNILGFKELEDIGEQKFAELLKSLNFEV